MAPLPKFQIPKLKVQINSKFQEPKFQTGLAPAGTDWILGPWSLFGIWDLEFGILTRDDLR
jgi:hypothetical protein